MEKNKVEQSWEQDLFAHALKHPVVVLRLPAPQRRGDASPLQDR